jgi:subtilisin family serine protease
MAGHSFRLLLLGGPDAVPVATIQAELRRLQPQLTELGIPSFEVHELPRFDFLEGDRRITTERPRLAPDSTVSQSVRQAIQGTIAFAKIVVLPGPSFARAPEIIGGRIEEWGYRQQSDPAIGPTLWAPSDAFGTFDEAKRLIGMTSQRGNSPVNVVIVDQGFDQSLVAPPFGGGWYKAGPNPQLPGQGNSRHALTTARAVRALAPDATLFDAPLIPTPAPGAPATIADVEAFADDAIGLWLAIWATLLSTNDPASWVFVNAWALSDVSSERLAPHPHYSTDRDHLLNQLHDAVIGTRNIDVVYAAGNCGQYQPDSRCGRNDRGPCRSIWGANSLDTVLTVAAVRSDRTWLGYSSQGPGQPDLGSNKPDLAAPTQFADDHDAAWIYGGTSAACAVAAGVVAALRSKRPQLGAGALGPAALKAALQAACLKPELNQPEFELGAGVIRFGETFNAI